MPGLMARKRRGAFRFRRRFFAFRAMGVSGHLKNGGILHKKMQTASRVHDKRAVFFPLASSLRRGLDGGADKMRKTEGRDRRTVTAKRIFDIGFALVLMVPALPVLGIVWVIMRMQEGRAPFLFVSERMKTVDQPFMLYKIRTMRCVHPQENRGVAGGDKTHRITPLGRFLRRTRIDELPQLFNVLRGDMSFVGPRPPDPNYVRAFPGLYGQILKSKPGITGLATIIYHNHEEHILARCKTPEETDAVYRRRCIPRKARLDLIYQRNANLRLDLYIMYLTAAELFRLPRRKAVRWREIHVPAE